MVSTTLGLFFEMGHKSRNVKIKTLNLKSQTINGVFRARVCLVNYIRLLVTYRRTNRDN